MGGSSTKNNPRNTSLVLRGSRQRGPSEGLEGPHEGPPCGEVLDRRRQACGSCEDLPWDISLGKGGRILEVSDRRGQGEERVDTLSKHLFAPLFALVIQTHGTRFQMDKLGLLNIRKRLHEASFWPIWPPRPSSPPLLRRYVSVGVFVRRAGRVWRCNIGSSTTPTHITVSTPLTP